jgi:hypothetical protein
LRRGRSKGGLDLGAELAGGAGPHLTTRAYGDRQHAVVRQAVFCVVYLPEREALPRNLILGIVHHTGSRAKPQRAVGRSSGGPTTLCAAYGRTLLLAGVIEQEVELAAAIPRLPVVARTFPVEAEPHVAVGGDGDRADVVAWHAVSLGTFRPGCAIEMGEAVGRAGPRGPVRRGGEGVDLRVGWCVGKIGPSPSGEVAVGDLAQDEQRQCDVQDGKPVSGFRAAELAHDLIEGMFLCLGC